MSSTTLSNASTASRSSTQLATGLVKKISSNEIFAGRYNVTVGDGKVSITDKSGGGTATITSGMKVSTTGGEGTTVENGNVTLRLHDGTKVTVVPGKDANGNPTVDKVVVTRGHEGYDVTGLNGTPTISARSEQAGVLKKSVDNGTTLTSKKSINSLVSSNGTDLPTVPTAIATAPAATVAQPLSQPVAATPAATTSAIPAAAAPASSTPTTTSTPTSTTSASASTSAATDPTFLAEQAAEQSQQEELMAEQSAEQLQSETFATRSACMKDNHDTNMSIISKL